MAETEFQREERKANMQVFLIVVAFVVVVAILRQWLAPDPAKYYGDEEHGQPSPWIGGD